MGLKKWVNGKGKKKGGGGGWGTRAGAGLTLYVYTECYHHHHHHHHYHQFFSGFYFSSPSIILTLSPFPIIPSYMFVIPHQKRCDSHTASTFFCHIKLENQNPENGNRPMMMMMIMMLMMVIGDDDDQPRSIISFLNLMANFGKSSVPPRPFSPPPPHSSLPTIELFTPPVTF